MSAKTNTSARVHYGTDAEKAAYTGPKQPGDEYITPTGVYGWDGIAWRGGSTVTTPGAYPYTTLDTDQEVNVDTAGGARTIKLASGTTLLDQVIMDGADNSGVNNITVGVADATKTLNGVVNGTVMIAVSGALRGFHRDTNGNWHGGV